MKLIKDDIRRCAIFLFYDKDGIADDYVIYLLECLKKSVEDILIVCNGNITADTNEKFLRISKDILMRENTGFDVGGYREGLFYYGFEKLERYDEVVLLNYTFFGPLFPFEEMFDAMADRNIDFWGITGHFQVTPDPYGQNRYGYMPEHIQSHFLVIRKSMLVSKEYKKFIISMKNPTSYVESICDYESIFKKYFEDLGFVGDVYCDEKEYEDYVFNPVMFRLKDMIVRKRCPIIKRRSFFTNYQDFMLNSCGETTAEVYDYLKQNLNYDLNMIWDNLLRLENMSEISKAMQLNYVLSQYECNELDEDKAQSVAVTVYVQSAMHIQEYLGALESIPKMVTCYIFADKEVLESLKKIEFFNRQKCQMIELNNRQNYPDIFENIVNTLVEKYEYIGFLEIKDCRINKPYSNIVSWQYSDWKNILPSEEFVNNVIDTFEDNERLGMLIPPIPDFGSLFADAEDGWFGHYENVATFITSKRMSVNIKRIDEPLTPIGGSFWIRSEALRRQLTIVNSLHELKDSYDVMLTIPFIVQLSRYYVGTVYNSEYASITVTNEDYMMRELNKTVFDKYGPSFHTIVVERIKKNEFLNEKNKHIQDEDDAIESVSDDFRDKYVPSMSDKTKYVTKKTLKYTLPYGIYKIGKKAYLKLRKRI